MKKVGLKATLEGIRTFEHDSESYAKSVRKMLGVSKEAAATIGTGMAAAGLGVTGLGTAVGVAGTVFNAALTPLKMFGNALGGLGQITGGLQLSSMIDGIRESLGDLAKQALEAAGDFQMLSIKFEGLIARELRTTDATLSVAGSFERAGPAAEDLLLWIRKLAVESPFTVKTIANAQSLAMSFSFTTAQSKILTSAISDFTAGMGLTEEHMQRIIINFGQMKAAGKVMGTELRDLARGSFVPVLDIIQKIADEMGLTFEEVKKQLSTGALPVDVFFAKFIEMARSEFPDAAQRMMRTWQGVTSNAQDFVEIMLGVELLGPVFQRFTGVAADSLQQLMGPESQRLFHSWGQSLDETFGSIAEGALVWGNNMIVSFGRGIINGASEVLNAVAQIANMIADLLMAHSPPKILPDIGIWGKETAEEWIKGWTKADVANLKDLAGRVESFMKSLGTDKDASSSMVKGIHEALISGFQEITKTGTLTPQSLDSILGALGPAQKSLEAYVRTMLEMAQQDRIVADLQSEVNRITAEYGLLLAPLERRLKKATAGKERVENAKRLMDLSELLARTDLTADERARLAATREEVETKQQIALLEAERDAKLEGTLTELEQATFLRDRLKERADIMAGIIDLQTETNRMWDEEAEKAKSAIGKIGGALGGLGGAVDDLWEDLQNLFGDDAGDGFDTYKGPKALTELEQLLLKLKKSAREAQTALVNMFNAIDQETKPAQEALTELSEVALPELKAAWQIFWPTIVGVTAWAATNITEDLNTLIELLAPDLADSLKDSGADFGLWASIAVSMVALGISDITAQIVGGTLFWQKLFKVWRAITTLDVDELWTDVGDLTTIFFALFTRKTGESFTDSYNRVLEFRTNVRGAFVLLWAGVVKDAVEFWNWLTIEFPKTILENARETWRGLGQELASGVAGGIRDRIEEIASAAVDLVNNALSRAKKAAKSHSPSQLWRTELGQPLGEGAAEGLLDMVPKMRAVADLMMRDVIPSASSIYNNSVSNSRSFTDARVFQLNATTSKPLSTVRQEFFMMEAMA